MSIDFSYLIGLVRTLEAKALSVSHLDRMIESNSVEDAYNVLYDTYFADSLSEIDNYKDYNKALTNSLLNTKNILKKGVEEDSFFNPLFLDYDLHNFTVSVKAKLKNKTFAEIKDLLSPLGNIDFKIFKNYLENKGLEDNNLKSLEKEIKNYLKDFNNDLRFVDFVCDQYLFKNQISWAKKNKSKIYLEFLEKKIDYTNALIALRAKKEEKDKLKETIFLKGGTQSLSFWVNFNFNSSEDLTRIFTENLVKEFQKNKVFTYLQKNIQDELTKKLQETKYLSEGVSPLIGHFYGKNLAVKIIRMILIAKQNKISTEDLRKQLFILF
jgi:V/A-type H+-transporting ATPase subunit C